MLTLQVKLARVTKERDAASAMGERLAQFLKSYAAGQPWAAYMSLHGIEQYLQEQLAALKQENDELLAVLRKSLTLAEEGIAHPEAGDYYFQRIASELRAALDAARATAKQTPMPDCPLCGPDCRCPVIW